MQAYLIVLWQVPASMLDDAEAATQHDGNGLSTTQQRSRFHLGWYQLCFLVVPGPALLLNQQCWSRHN